MLSFVAPTAEPGSTLAGVNVIHPAVLWNQTVWVVDQSWYGQDISMHIKTPIVNINGNLNARQYQNQIVQPFILPHLAVHRGMALTEDNALCHVT